MTDSSASIIRTSPSISHAAEKKDRTLSEPGASAGDLRQILASAVRVPRHVVYRAFPRETVLLNLNTGRYHGLNPTGAHMLEILEQSETAGAAAAQLAEEYGLPLQEIEIDLCDLCRDLHERDLVEIVPHVAR